MLLLFVPFSAAFLIKQNELFTDKTISTPKVSTSQVQFADGTIQTSASGKCTTIRVLGVHHSGNLARVTGYGFQNTAPFLQCGWRVSGSNSTIASPALFVDENHVDCEMIPIFAVDPLTFAMNASSVFVTISIDGVEFLEEEAEFFEPPVAQLSTKDFVLSISDPHYFDVTSPPAMCDLTFQNGTAMSFSVLKITQHYLVCPKPTGATNASYLGHEMITTVDPGAAFWFDGHHAFVGPDDVTVESWLDASSMTFYPAVEHPTLVEDGLGNYGVKFYGADRINVGVLPKEIEQPFSITLVGHHSDNPAVTGCQGCPSAVALDSVSDANRTYIWSTGSLDNLEIFSGSSDVFQATNAEKLAQSVLVAVFDGPDSFIYFNGRNLPFAGGSQTVGSSTLSSIVLGNAYLGAGNYSWGTIQHIAIFPYRLSYLFSDRFTRARCQQHGISTCFPPNAVRYWDVEDAVGTGGLATGWFDRVTGSTYSFADGGSKLLDNCRGAERCLQFWNGDALVDNSINLPQPFTIVWAGKSMTSGLGHTNSPGTLLLDNADGGSDRVYIHVLTSNPNTLVMNAGASLNFNVGLSSLESWHVGVMLFDGAQSQLHFNGALLTPASGTTAGTRSLLEMAIGNVYVSHSGSYPWGELGAFYVLDGALSADERGAFVRSLCARFQVSCA